MLRHRCRDTNTHKHTCSDIDGKTQTHTCTELNAQAHLIYIYRPNSSLLSLTLRSCHHLGAGKERYLLATVDISRWTYFYCYFLPLSALFVHTALSLAPHLLMQSHTLADTSLSTPNTHPFLSLSFSLSPLLALILTLALSCLSSLSLSLFLSLSRIVCFSR